MSNWLVRHQRLVNASGAIAASFALARTVLLAWPEPYPWMFEAGELFYDLGLAWAAAWAFQFLVVILPAERERERFNALIAPRVDRLVVVGVELSTAIAKQAGKSPSVQFVLDVEALKDVCGTAGVQDEVSGWDGSWGSILRHWGSLAERSREALRPFYTRLIPEVLEALREEELAMEEILRMERFARTFDAPDMSRLEGPLFKWLTSIEMLVDERRKSLAPELPLPEQSALDTATIKVPLDDFIRQHEDFKKSLEPETKNSGLK